MFLHLSVYAQGWSPGPHPEVRLRGLAGGSPGPHLEGVLQAHTWGGFQADTWGGGRVFPGRHPGGGCIPACTEADTPKQTATATSSTHPTGMHSCYPFFFPDTICTIFSRNPYRSFRLTETDSGTHPDSDSNPDGYIVTCRTCLHCTDSESDSYSPFLYRTGIQVL